MSVISNRIQLASPDQLEMSQEAVNRIQNTIDDFLEGKMSYRDSNGELVTFKVKEFRFEKPTTFDDPAGSVVIWPNNEAVLFTNEVIGKGLTKTVYYTLDLINGTYCAGSFGEKNEIKILTKLQNKRGIAQIYNSMNGKFPVYRNLKVKSEYKDFFYGKLYDCDLSERLKRCDLNDIKVIVKDLIYAIIALEGEDPNGPWIYHRDIKDANVFLELDDSGNVTKAVLGDFGSSGEVTAVYTEEEIKKADKKFGPGFYPTRGGQRKQFMQYLFHLIKTRLDHIGEKTSLVELCEDDPNCKKVMEEMMDKYGSLLEQKYFHWQD